MKTPILPAFLASLFGLALAPALHASQRLLLIDANFNKPTESTSNFPPATDEKWVTIPPGLDGWAKGGGQISLTYGANYGRDNSGGVRAVVKKEFAETMTAVFHNINFPMLRAGYSIAKPIRSIKFSIDASIPVGQTVDVQIVIITPKTWEKDDPLVGWRNRLILGTLTGAGEYRHYTCDMENLPEETITKFITYIRDIDLNGIPDVIGDLELFMSPKTWREGDEFWFDNLVFSIEGQ